MRFESINEKEGIIHNVNQMWLDQYVTRENFEKIDEELI